MTSSRHRFLTGAAPLALLLLCGSPAPAQSTSPPPGEDAPRDRGRPESPTGAETAETGQSNGAPRPDRFALDEIVVSATRSGRTGFETPYSAETIGSDVLLERAYRSTPEALRDIPGVMVQKTAFGQGSPYIRGFTGFRTLLLVDGIRLNNSVFRDGPNQYWNTVDPLSIERYEVIKGPSSVLYGSDAIGGTVSAFSKSPYTYTDGANAGARGYYRYGSADNSNVGRIEIGASSGERFGVIGGFSLKEFNDLRAGSPTDRQPETGYTEYDADAKAEYWLNPSTRVVFAHQSVRQNNVPRSHRTVFARSFEGTTIGSDLRRELDQERHLTYVQLHAEEMDSVVDAMSFNVSWHQQEETRDRIRGSGARELQGFEAGTLGLWAQLTSETPIGRFTYGAEWYRDFVSSFSSTNPIQGPVGDDATYDVIGVYVQNEFDLGKRLSVILGGRFNYARADANSVQDPASGNRIEVNDDWSAFVGSARLTYRAVPDHLNIFGGVSQGFRAPNLSDLTRLDTARTNEIETPSPGLDSERYLTYEVGFKARGDRWAAQASYYYTDLDDVIIRTPTGRTIGSDNEVTKLNSDGGFVQGVELGATVRADDQWSVFGSFAWLEGEEQTFPTSTSAPVDEPISRLMPVTGQLGLRYDSPDQRFWAEGLVTIAGDADRLSTRDKADTSRIPPGGTPGYEVFTVRGGWRATEHANLLLAFENLTDEDYRVHGSGQNEPGFNVVLGVEVQY